MAIDSVLNSVLNVLALSDASKAAITAGFPTCGDLKDLFMDLAADKKKVEATFRLVTNTDIVTDIDVHCVVFVSDWFMVNIVDPNFTCSTFTISVYAADKHNRSVTKAVATTPTTITTSTPIISSTIDFSTDVILADAKRQALPTTPGTVATLKPHKLWKSPFTVSSRSRSNTHQLHNMDLVLASSLQAL
jgi:hypothetical protein